jgi:glucokinase
MFLGIEIGGTKLQLAVGTGEVRPLVDLRRAEIRPEDGAGGILRQIEAIGRELIERHRPTAIGIGFGGPVDAKEGRTITSHQVEGWNDFALTEWCRDTFGLPAAISNDADAAGLAEALFGAGRRDSIVFYITVGSGIGGALVKWSSVYSGGQGIASEIGHLRPGLDADDPHATVESYASGFGMASRAQAWLRAAAADDLAAIDFLSRCDGKIEQLSGRMVVDAAAAGNVTAQGIFAHALQTLGWAIAQMITLIAPQVVVIGGGVPLAGETMFFEPLRHEVARYVFPPLAKSYAIVPAALGEEVVLYGALAVAALRHTVYYGDEGQQEND